VQVGWRKRDESKAGEENNGWGERWEKRRKGIEIGEKIERGKRREERERRERGE